MAICGKPPGTNTRNRESDVVNTVRDIDLGAVLPILTANPKTAAEEVCDHRKRPSRRKSNLTRELLIIVPMMSGAAN